jgi:hypothetical protein
MNMSGIYATRFPKLNHDLLAAIPIHLNHLGIDPNDEFTSSRALLR